MLLQKEKDILDRKLSQMNEEMNEYQSRAVYDKLSRSTRLNYFKYLLCCKFNNPLNDEFYRQTGLIFSREHL